MEEESKKRSLDENEEESSLTSANAVVEEEEVTIETIRSINKQYNQSLFDTVNSFNPNPDIAKSQYSFVKNGKRFGYHTPSENLILPKKPALNQSDHGSLRDLFEIRLSSDSIVYCDSDTQKLYEDYRDDEDRNVFIKGREGAISFLNEALNENNFMDTRKLWAMPGEGKFIDMMRHVLTDYYQGCRRATSINTNQERTFFCEVIIPIFKNFGIMIGSLSGSWRERQLVELRRIWLPLKDFWVSGINKKLLDGILTNEAESMAIMLKSSGSELNVTHTIDDTYKQLKSTSDFLKSKIVYHPNHQSTKKLWIKIFEFLAFLGHVVETSLVEINQLENELLGYVELSPEEVLIKDYFI
ncbi:hypothetical protein G6F61_007589 [Rhizopus arrhizus]|nr:hypothetical protein G6F61_007589 [Rhizopus arrhizus]